MAVEQIDTGENKEIAAESQETGDKVATEDGLQTDSSAAESSQKMVPLSALEAEREKRQTAEAKAEILATQATQEQPQPAQQAAPVQGSMFKQVATHLGYDPEEEYLTTSQTGHIVDTCMQLMLQQQNESSYMASHSDYEEVVGKTVNGRFVESPALKKVLEDNPELRQGLGPIANTPSAQIIAYNMVKKLHPDYQKAEGLSEAEKKELNAKKVIDAANKKQVSVSAVPGGGQVDKASQIAAMTDEEFAAHKDAVMAKA